MKKGKKDWKSNIVVTVVLSVLAIALVGTASATAWDESEFSQQVFGVGMTREFVGENARWTIQMSDIAGHWSTGVQLIICDGREPKFKLGWSPGESTTSPVYKPYNLGSGWGTPTTTLPPGMSVSGSYNQEYYEIIVPVSYLGGSGATFYWALNAEASWPGHSSSVQQNFPADWVRWTATNSYQDCVPTCEIPEFTTIAIPVAVILGLLFFFNHRKRSKT
jgi:hypothetical protein